MKMVSKHPWARTMRRTGFTVVIIAGCASIPAPTDQIAVSKEAVSNASSAGGNEFASAEMHSAQDKLDRATQAMAEKDYPKALSLAEQAQVDAQLAEAKARTAKAEEAAASIQEGSDILREEMNR